MSLKAREGEAVRPSLLLCGPTGSHCLATQGLIQPLELA